ncbi:hypothetical protein N7452_009727 [Penicillium brevicompactum]|uniref:Zn(2)-C6 fungal-type domain-containing protein n=1 Tax=Penicillium brevicompactum TaxID=5074 RepID=A0A9W9Q8U6_PENBR|nr:hypothetical protein N7452_009727 [Penicillium brevicompactum]
MRSYTGCMTCRGRKLKCDEAKPVCGPCVKADRECRFEERCIFRNQNVPSPKRKPQRRAGARKRRVREEPEELGDQTWVDVPHELTFIQVDDPFSPERENLLQRNNPDTAPGQDNTSAQGGEECQEGGSSPGPTVEPDSLLERVNSFLRHERALDAYQGSRGKRPHGSLGGALLSDSPGWHTPSTNVTVDTPASVGIAASREESSGKNSDSKVILSHMLRHFKEGPGQWMDLFDTTAYFSSKVPVLAATRPLLKSAVCALSAKHLQHVYRVSAAENRKSSLLPFADEETWQYQSAKNYDQALGLLKTAINRGTYNDSPSDKEEMLATVAILCLYELMDAPGTAWQAHLSALPLFNDTSASMPAQSSVIIPKTAIKGPIFWSLARQDLLCAFISETYTRLDLKDVRLWQNVGLVTDEYGNLFPTPAASPFETQNSLGIEEDMKSNELTWLLGKIANHLTAGDSIIPEDFILPREERPDIGVTQELLYDRWEILMSELDKWYDCLPSTFTEAARTRGQGNSHPVYNLAFETFEQIWFDLPLCAATVQSYHQARILLLVNQPQLSTAIRSTVSARLRAYRHALKEALYHAREICGINLANPADPVRINSVQALFVAGQVFQGRREQDAVLEILTGIERDLGWTTQYHVAKLVDEWGRRDEISLE